MHLIVAAGSRDMLLRIWVMMMALLMLNGCASLMVEEYAGTGGGKITERSLGTERIIGFTRPAASAGCDAACQSKLVMVSQEHAYVLDHSIGDVGMLELLGSGLDISRLSVKGEQNEPLELSVRVNRATGRFALPVVMFYGIEADAAFSIEEQATLARLVSEHQWVQVDERHYRSEYRLEGVMYPPVKNLDEVLANSAVQGQYLINVIEYSRRERLNTKAILKPFAVVFDVVTFPIQFVVVVLGGGIAEGLSL